MTRLKRRRSTPWIGLVPLILAAAAAAVLSGALGTTRSHAAAPTVAVFPIAGDRYAAPSTQLTFRGIPIAQLGTLTVTGSQSGVHAGTLEADSDGGGGSFEPTKPFTAGEKVTVKTALNIVRANKGTYSFTVETPGNPVPAKPLPKSALTKGSVNSFVSRPDLRPAALTVDKRPTKATAPGDIFLGTQAGPVRNGNEILDPNGGLLWYYEAPKGQYVTDFTKQTYQGKPALTWWQGNVNTSGVGYGVDEIYNSSYRHLATVTASNGLQSDVHEFLLGANGTAWVTAYQPVIQNASAIKHGSKREIVFDSVAQEIDIKTGLVLYQWDSLDHVALARSYSPVARKTGVPWDYFHINSIEPESDGSIVISSRNTSAIYRVSGQTGAIQWTLGGKDPSFKMGPNTMFYYQHDARLHGDTISLFDDAGQPFMEKQSRALTLKLDTKANTATLASQFFHTPALKAPAEGNLQVLPNGDEMVGWGQAPFITEFNSKGQEVFDAHFNGFNATYRAFRFPWTGAPIGAPSIATRVSRGQTVVYASWNGSTVLAKWEVLGGSSPTSLKPVGGGARAGFETAVRLGGREAYVEVQALDQRGKVLGTSKAVKG